MNAHSLFRFVILGAILMVARGASACFIQMNSQEEICYGESLTINPIVIPAGGTYLWSTGETTASITVSPSVTTSYTLTYTNGACVVSKTVLVIVSVAAEAELIGNAVCTDANGIGTTNLLDFGLVNFWEDKDATIPVTNPSNYSVTITNQWDTLYATTGNPPCYDVLYTIILCKHPTIDQSQFTLSQFPEEVCEIPNYVTLVYTVPQTFFQNLCPGYAFTSYGTQTGYPGVPWISTNGFAYPFSYQNGNFAFAAFAFNNIEDDITVSFDKIEYYSSGCPLVDFEPDLTFVVQTNLINLSVSDLTTCEGSSVDLTALASTTSSFPISFHSDASASAASLITSPYTVTSSQTIYAKITNPNPFCENIKPIDITVLPNVQVTVQDGQVCQFQTLDLTSLTVSPTAPGAWSGMGVTNNTFTSGSAGSFTLTFDPTTACYLTDEVEIEVLPQPTIVLGATALCDIGGPLPLASIEDPNFPLGTWSGTNVSGGTFDPAGLQGSYTLTFTPSSQYTCAISTNTQVTVTKAVEPVILDQLFCEAQGQIDLNGLVDPIWLGGAWTGMGLNGNLFDPTGLSGAYLLNYNAPSACALPTDVFIEVQSVAFPEISDIDWCEGGTPLDLRNYEDPFFSGGVWTGPGVFGNIWDPIGQGNTTLLTYQSNSFCTSEVEMTISLYESIKVDDLTVACYGNFYTVSFTIEGGNADKLLVNGQATGAAFSFGPIASDTAYRFEITDSSFCSNILLEGVKKCACFKDAGTLEKPMDTITICATDTLRLIHNQDETLQAGDRLVFVLHDRPGLTLGNIFSIQAEPVFVKPQGVENNRVYYVTAIAGEVLNDTLNLRDPCLSLAPGVPVEFYQPGILPIKDSLMCRSACVSYPLVFKGEPPYRAVISWGAANWQIKDTLVTFRSDTTILICPEWIPFQTDTLQIRSEQISDQNCVGSSQILGSLVLTSPSMAVINPVLCQSDSLLYLGKVYKSNSKPDTIVFSAANTSFCDTTIIVAPQFLTESEQIIAKQLCVGQSLLINGQLYNELRPNGKEILPGAAANGCDSTIIVDLRFGSQSIYDFKTTICKNDSIVVNGNVYNASNPSGQELLPGAAEGGCDSLILIAVQILDDVQAQVNPLLCRGESVIVNGNTYDESNPVGLEIIQGGSVLGCDSIINVALQFRSVDTTWINQKICEGESILINGVLYNKDKLNGFSVFKTAAGCDSMVNVAIEIYYQPMGSYSATLCKGDTLVLQNTSFYEGKSSGAIVINGGAANGCDSMVMVNIDFLKEARGTYNVAICEEDTVTIQGTRFYKGKTNGTLLFKAGAASGCDSLLDVTIDLLPTKLGVFETSLCKGDTLRYGDELFYEGKTTGQIKWLGASNEGCDSVVNVVLNFYPELAVDTLRITAAEETDSYSLGGQVFDIKNPEGKVQLTDLSSTGCDSFVYVVMKFPETFRNVNFTTVSASCPGESDGVFTLIGAEGCGPDRLLINNKIYAIEALPFSVDSLPPGEYTWQLESDSRCSYSGQFTIEEAEEVSFVISPMSIEVPARSETLLDLEVNPAPATALWPDAAGLSCNDCLTPIVSAPADVKDYLLVLTNERGCAQEFSIRIIPIEAVPSWPNVIYPEGGGVNGVFRIPNENNTLSAVTIYDRWGNALVRQNNFAFGESFEWDGAASGRRVNSGVYLVAVQYNDGSAEWVEVTVL